MTSTFCEGRDRDTDIDILNSNRHWQTFCAWRETNTDISSKARYWHWHSEQEERDTDTNFLCKKKERHRHWHFVQELTLTLTLTQSQILGFSVPGVCRRTLWERSFQYIGPVIWSCLPFSVRHATSLSSLKPKLKTHLFSSAYWFIIFFFLFP